MIPADELRTIGMRRECGGCTACCYVIEVPGLTGFRSKCQHAVPGQGCRIWSGPGGPGGQPEICSQYRCAWAMGFGDEADRPDKSGLLVDFRVGNLLDVLAGATAESPAFYGIGLVDGMEDLDSFARAKANIERDTGWPVNLGLA